ncbi:MAG: hypothetical protein GXP49_05925 [Deltaproteobacteria bacterium]|nr:hypothetical protein [Deltaproteobacteria bacterium]
MVKRLLVLLTAAALVLVIGCKGKEKKSGEGEAVSSKGHGGDHHANAAEKSGSAATNVKKKKDKGKIIPDDILNRMNGKLSTGKPYISDETWSKVEKFADSLAALKKQSKGPRLEKSAVDKALKDAGYDSRESAQKDLEKVAGLQDTIMGIGMKIGSLKMVKAMDGEKAEAKAIDDLAGKLKEKGLTKNDIMLMETKSSTIGKAFGALILLKASKN